MADTQPEVDEEQVLDLLHEHFSNPAVDLERVTGGQIATTFSFRVGAQEYILRINANSMLVNLDKEVYVFDHFASPRLPIPRIVATGRLGELHFAISDRVRGDTLANLPRPEYRAIIPQLVETVDALRQADLHGKQGYGIFDARGNGLFPGWRDFLAFIEEEGAPGDFFEGWHRLFTETFLEREVWYGIYDRMTELLDYCPTERYLVHGNVSVSNVLAYGGRITGVIDWIDARYGDFMYDVACLALWSPGDDYEGRFRDYYATLGVEVPNYDERLLCYECCIGLDALRFFAKMGKQPEYIWTRDRILSLLAR